MQTVRRAVVVLAAVALWASPVAVAQTRTLPQNAAGVSTQPPVPLGGGERKREPEARRSATELPNTGSDPRLLFAVGAALTLLGVGLRLRTADADVY